MIAALGGINYYHHFCNDCDEELYSVFTEQKCTHESEHNSCASETVDKSCCESEESTSCGNSISDKCCENELKQLKIEDSFLGSNKFSIPLVIVPITLTFNESPDEIFNVNEHTKYLESRLNEIRSPQKVIIDYIHSLLSSSRTDSDSDFPSGI